MGKGKAAARCATGSRGGPTSYSAPGPRSSRRSCSRPTRRSIPRCGSATPPRGSRPPPPFPACPSAFSPPGSPRCSGSSACPPGPGRAMARSPRPLRLVAPTAAATLVTAPVTAFAFGTVAPIGVVANLVAIPLAAVAVPGLALALALSWIATALARLLAAGAGLGLALLDAVARLAAWVPGGRVIRIAGWRGALVWPAVAAAAWWLWTSPRRRWLVAGRCAFIVTLVCWAPVADTALGGASLDACRCLTVHFLDVGQGDAAALRTPAGRWVVVDGGPRAPGSDAGRRVVVPLFRRRGAGPLGHGGVRRVAYGAVGLMLQAAAGLPVEARLAGRVGAVELLKVGHHGSRSATSDAWLTELGPREAVISVGRRNHYGHPAPEVLARLARHGVAILRTDESGTITFSTDGHGGRVRSHHD